MGCTEQEGGAGHLTFALNDLPTNNWNAVSTNFCAPNELGTEPSVLLSMVPRSFYAGPLLPNGSFHVGLCNNVLLWRSASPYASVPDHIVYFNQGNCNFASVQISVHVHDGLVVCARIRTACHNLVQIYQLRIFFFMYLLYNLGSRSNRRYSFVAGEHAESTFKQQATDDLHAFLKFRAAEIMPGGMLLLITPGTLGSQCSYASLFDAFVEAGRQLVDEGRVDRYLFQEFVLPVYFFSAQV